MARPEPSSAPIEQARLDVLPAVEDVADIHAGEAEAAAGEGVAVTPEELAGWESTGELPSPVEARLAARG